MGSPTAPLDLTLSDHESQIHGYPDFEVLCLVKELSHCVCGVPLTID